MFRTVIFDLDGTLLDTLADLADASNWVCGEMGWPTHPQERYRMFVGNGIPKLVERFAPAEASAEDLKRALTLFGLRYAAHKEDKTAPYPGIPELLEHLTEAGVVFGVVTNKDDTPAREVLRHYFGTLIPAVQGRVDGLPAKPDPSTTICLMERLGADPASTLFVGDSNVDISTAKNAALPACGVLWGFRSRTELEQAGADYLAENTEELERLILGE